MDLDKAALQPAWRGRRRGRANTLLKNQLDGRCYSSHRNQTAWCWERRPGPTKPGQLSSDQRETTHSHSKSLDPDLTPPPKIKPKRTTQLNPSDNAQGKPSQRQERGRRLRDDTNEDRADELRFAGPENPAARTEQGTNSQTTRPGKGLLKHHSDNTANPIRPWAKPSRDISRKKMAKLRTRQRQMQARTCSHKGSPPGWRERGTQQPWKTARRHLPNQALNTRSGGNAGGIQAKELETHPRRHTDVHGGFKHTRMFTVASGRHTDVHGGFRQTHRCSRWLYPNCQHITATKMPASR